MRTQKNMTLERLKLFASYMVVFIHVRFYGDTGIVVDALARFAVPLFFLISGFYSYGITTDKFVRRIKSILGVLLLAIVCYTVYNVSSPILKGDAEGIIQYFSAYLNVSEWLKLILFNSTIQQEHFWYLFAIIYVYIVFYFITKFRINEKAVFLVSFLLLGAHILLGEGLAVFGIVIPIPYIRNFLFMGIPFFSLGLFAKKYQNKFRTVPGYMIFIFIVTGAIETVISRYLVGKNELYVGAILILLACVIVFTKYSGVNYPKILSALSGCSTYIYIFHVMVAEILLDIYAFAFDYSSSVILQMLHPLIVCVVSTLLSYLIVQGKKP